MPPPPSPGGAAGDGGVAGVTGVTANGVTARGPRCSTGGTTRTFPSGALVTCHSPDATAASGLPLPSRTRNRPGPLTVTVGPVSTLTRIVEGSTLGGTTTGRIPP